MHSSIDDFDMKDFKTNEPVKIDKVCKMCKKTKPIQLLDNVCDGCAGTIAVANRALDINEKRD